MSLRKSHDEEDMTARPEEAKRSTGSHRWRGSTEFRISPVTKGSRVAPGLRVKPDEQFAQAKGHPVRPEPAP